ncbi:MAG: DUF1648 domain-containing protein [Terracidiphilus sp.]
MRKTAELLSLAALAVLGFVTINAFYGPHPLPNRIPTHFDSLGNVNRWGSSRSLLFFPVFTVAIYLLLTLVSRFPSKFNYPVKVTELNRAQLESMALSLLSWTKAEVLVFFVWMENAMVQAARDPERGLKPYPILAFVIALFGTLFGHIVAMFRARNPAQ